MRLYRYIAYFVVFFALALLVGPITILLAFLVPLIDYFISQRRARVTYPEQLPTTTADNTDVTTNTEATASSDNQTAAHSDEPSHLIVVNPTRGNEPDGVILVYDEQGFIEYNGITVSKSDVVDVTFNNAAIPYVPNDYQVVITTRDPAHKYIRIPVGADSKWAMEVVAQIRQYLKL